MKTPAERIASKDQCKRRTGWEGYAWLVAALLIAIPPPIRSLSYLDEDTERLLVDAVEAAAEYDLYNTRCRRDVSGRRTDNLNKELVSKFRMTVIKVQDDLFPERSYRRVQERLQTDFLKKLKNAGGCRSAKEQGMPGELRNRYDDLMRELERLP